MLRIGVLEWICGGGLAAIPVQQIPTSLLREGWLMLAALSSDLQSTELQVVTTVEPRLVTALQIDALSKRGCLVRPSPCVGDEALPYWAEIFREVDWLITIAPECDGVLESLLAELTSRGRHCVNCSGEFLANCCDKLRTSQRLSLAGLPHPKTILLGEISPSWLREHAEQSEYWAVKPRDGAGCGGLLRVNSKQLQELISLPHDLNRSGNLIVQPWRAGIPCSRSAIVDRAGKCHWLPLVTQTLSLADVPKYLGGSVLALGPVHAPNGENIPIAQGTRETEFISDAQSIALDEMLTQAVKAMGATALGWIGVDLLYDDASPHCPFTIIEFNSRLTSSFVGLTESCGGGLAKQLVAAATGEEVRIPNQWSIVHFNC